MFADPAKGASVGAFAGTANFKRCVLTSTAGGWAPIAKRKSARPQSGKLAMYVVYVVCAHASI